MGNPAVFELESRKIGGYSVRIEERLGEEIRICIDRSEAGFSVSEFRKLCAELCEMVNKRVDIPGFDCHRIEPVFLQVMLCGRLENLRRISIDRVCVKDLLVLEEEVCPLPKSFCARALAGEPSEHSRLDNVHHKGMSDQERLEGLLKSVRENGYPYNGEYIILYGDDNIIMDGQHRAACLWKLDPEAVVPVQRFYFEDYVTPTAVPKWKRSAAYQLLRKCRLSLRSGIRLLASPERRKRRFEERRGENAREAARRREEAYLKEHGAEHNEILHLLRQK
ncbi:MAG: hypothetical protein LUE24_10100 [Lachnospiraceae bacterium]|nr:hypothetical protein [Lachnospiraceae bacterium]